MQLAANMLVRMLTTSFLWLITYITSNNLSRQGAMWANVHQDYFKLACSHQQWS